MGRDDACGICCSVDSVDAMSLNWKERKSKKT